jgi:hypothetical protein
MLDASKIILSAFIVLILAGSEGAACSYRSPGCAEWYVDDNGHSHGIRSDWRRPQHGGIPYRSRAAASGGRTTRGDTRGGSIAHPYVRSGHAGRRVNSGMAAGYAGQIPSRPRDMVDPGRASGSSLAPGMDPSRKWRLPIASCVCADRIVG